MSVRVEVAIVGAGFAGIAAALALRRAGRHSFVMIERAAAVGGAWRDNTYPGVACDVPSALYCFASHPNPTWSGTFATGREIADYLEDVVAREDLSAHLRLRSPLVAATWLPDAGRWRVDTGGPDPVTVEAEVLVLACGRLTEPAIPEIPGLTGFPGALFHSARWDHDVDLAGSRVAVVGTGASAVQIVPQLARDSRVTLFQRTPAWIVPRHGRRHPPAERAWLAAHPEALDARRAVALAQGEDRFASRSGDPRAAAVAERAARAHLAAQVPDADLRRALTPGYAFGCKRVLISDDFYPSVASDAVTLEPSALARVKGRTLVSARGRRFDADAIVFATGFASARQPYADLVVGEGATLADHWADGMTSFASTVVSGFPNMFVLNGPNASLGHNSAILMIEEQCAYLVRSLARRAAPTDILRADPAAERAYTAEIDDAARSTPWLTGGCRNWYVDDRSGRLTLLWPGTVEDFRRRLAAADGTEFTSAPVAGTRKRPS